VCFTGCTKATELGRHVSIFRTLGGKLRELDPVCRTDQGSWKFVKSSGAGGCETLFPRAPDCKWFGHELRQTLNNWKVNDLISRSVPSGIRAGCRSLLQDEQARASAKCAPPVMASPHEDRAHRHRSGENALRVADRRTGQQSDYPSWLKVPKRFDFIGIREDARFCSVMTRNAQFSVAAGRKRPEG